MPLDLLIFGVGGWGIYVRLNVGDPRSSAPPGGARGSGYTSAKKLPVMKPGDESKRFRCQVGKVKELITSHERGQRRVTHSS